MVEPLDHFEQWLFNLELECSGASLAPLESIAIGGAVLSLPDLLAGMKAVEGERDDLFDALANVLFGDPGPKLDAAYKHGRELWYRLDAANQHRSAEHV